MSTKKRSESKTDPNSGFFSNLPMAEYHAPERGVSSTGFKEFLRSPAHFHQYMTGTRIQTPAMKVGEQCHGLLFENKVPVVMPKFDRRTTVGKEGYANFLKDNAGKDFIDAEDLAILQGVTHAVRQHPRLSSLLSEGDPEVSAFVRCPRTGLLLKARYDWLRYDGIVLDLKTTDKSAKPDTFERTIFGYGYHVSAAWYDYVYELLTGERLHSFVIIAAEKKAPFPVSAFRLKDEVMNLGRDLILQKLSTLAECIQSGEYPGYPTDIRDVGIPSWAISQTEALLLEGEEVA